MRYLTIRVGAAERTFEPGQSVRIGRDPHSDVTITNLNVSREHALVVNESGIWQLIDVGSSQGIWRDGRKVDRLEIRGTVHVTLGREDQGTTIVLDAPTGGREEEPVRPGGSLNDLDESVDTEIVGAQRAGRGRMDDTVIVNDSAPSEEPPRPGVRPTQPAGYGPGIGGNAPPTRDQTGKPTTSPIAASVIAVVIVLAVLLAALFFILFAYLLAG